MRKVVPVDDNGNPVSISTSGALKVDSSGSSAPVVTGVVTAGTSLNAVATNSTGSTVDFGSAMRDIAMVVSTTGSPNAGTVTLNVSVDGTNWFVTSTTAAVGATVSSGTLTGGAWRYARAVLASLGGGTTPTVTAKIAGA